jgi:hypothetical protein
LKNRHIYRPGYRNSYKAVFTTGLKYYKMTKYSTFLLSLLSAALLFPSCNGGDDTPKEVMGYAPIYQSDSSIAEIRSDDPQPILEGGKIYVRNKELYQVEKGIGIHVLDITDPAHPVKKAFIHIAGAQEISIKENLLYANNYNDLVVINISDIKHVQLVNRMKDVFHITGGNVPPEKGYFECVDASRGSVIGWQKKNLYSPKCKF